ncbi:type VI secretion system ATPase TssH [Enterobacillus tribolii]|uniref:Type VI secretion system protein VasG n=1 Tax=Enterobacillus tribolii TaxID=1487935 RepID=A0A370QHB6_9GAMM|nr:type VI secretion system ATPase TssH [Enterobacillus tribolii]MBW7982468.1 type VI secretion system ATPase TssH [Enterobacillus tribolii]RDK87747.1 type VI secretion system protein VasG [Enterobacillus tribolii]
MIAIDLPMLVNRLHPIARHGLESAAAQCVSAQEAEITVPQVLLQMVNTPLSDVRLILNRAEVDCEALRELLDNVQTGGRNVAASYPSFSPLLVEWLKDGWLLASAEFGHAQLRSGAMLMALLQSPNRYLPASAVQLLLKVNRALLHEEFDAWTAESAESAAVVKGGQAQAGQSGGESLLARFATDLTQAAREGKLDPVLCRDAEIDLMIDILCRRRKNNPIVVGEAGVGKSALIEGLALRVVADQVPEKLRNTRLMTLDLGALQAGAAVKGEFEKRFKGIMAEAVQSAEPVILFIDEAHTLIGAGNQQGGLDISNLLKPALARGELKTIAATTWSEYKKYFEKDAALSRRFQVVKVAEPTAAEATVILRGLRSAYENAHGVLIDDEALQAASGLSERYLSGRQLPDKAIDVLDTACARVAINLTSPPRQISALTTERHQLQQEIEQLEREQRIGLPGDVGYLASLHQRLAALSDTLSALDSDWRGQQERVRKVIALRAALLSCEGQPDEQQIAELAALTQELDDLQKDRALVSPHVGKKQIAAVIAEWTGVPLNRLSQSEMTAITELPEWLGQAIRGQDLAIAHLHKHLLTARADLRRPGRPLGAFLLVGPSGVGKTESVLQIADTLFGGRQYLTTINMSEFQEKHTVSRLIGSPPGYVGYGEGGVLTEAIRQKPYSVVLLDEVEKAHPDVLNLFYQAFDKGEIADGEGRVIDCKNVVFFLTSNLGYQVIVDHADAPDTLQDVLYPVLSDFFKPALLARMEVIPFMPLGSDTLTEIITGKLTRLENLLTRRFGATVAIDEPVTQEIMRRVTRAENGARMLESVIDGALLPPLSLLLLQHMAAGDGIRHIRVFTEENQFKAQVETSA